MRPVVVVVVLPFPEFLVEQALQDSPHPGRNDADAVAEGAYAFEALLRHDCSYTGYAAITGTRKLRAERNELPPDEWPTRLRRLISDQVSLILRRNVDPDRPLAEYGMDSLGALELRTRIETETGIRISSSDMTTTIRDLAGLLCEKPAPVEAA